jgi:hypothetical protein
MLDFDELKDAVANEDDEPFQARKADLTPLGSFAAMPEGVTVSVFDDYFPESAIWREGDQIVVGITEHIRRLSFCIAEEAFACGSHAGGRATRKESLSVQDASKGG